MKEPIKIFEAYDVVVLPFPFIDIDDSKRRPAVIISSAQHFNNSAKSCVMAMITTATHHPWPLDTEIQDLDAAGLPVRSMIRMKLFTIDYRLILKSAGKLGKHDRAVLSANLKRLLI